MKRVDDKDQSVWQGAVKSVNFTAPPSNPAKGDRYLIFNTGTGIWVGKKSKIAEYDGTTWFFIPPKPGMLLYNEGDDFYYKFSFSIWRRNSK